MLGIQVGYIRSMKAGVFILLILSNLNGYCGA